MKTCRDCIHYKACLDFCTLIDSRVNICGLFKDKSKFIELPCSIGDTVYYLATECDGCDEREDYCHIGCRKPKGYTKVNNTVIKQFRIHDNQFDSMTDTSALASTYSHDFYFRDIGKNVFLTQKEAEKKLEEMNGQV